MAQIEFSDFRNMTGTYVPALPETMHKEIRNAMPHTFLIVDERDDPTLYTKSNPAYQFILAPDLTSLSNSTLSGYPTAITPRRNSLGSFFSVTSDGSVYLVDGLTVTPTVNLVGSSASTSNINQIGIFSGYVCWAGENDSFYYMLQSSGFAAPSTVSGLGTNSGVNQHDFDVFLNSCYVLGTGSTYNNNGAIHKISTAFTKSSYVEINSVGYRYIKNVFDRYLAVAGTESSSLGTNDWRMDIFDGISTLPIYRIPIPGTFIGAQTHKGNYYIFYIDNFDLVCSTLSSFTLNEIGRIRNCRFPVTISTIDQKINHKSAVSVFEDYFTILVNYSSSDTNGNQCIVHWNVQTGENAIVYTNNTNAPCMIYSGADTAGRMNHFVGLTDVTDIYRLIPYGTTYQTSARYQSNFKDIPIVDKNNNPISKTQGRGKINRVDVIYNTPPPTSSDSITLTIKYQDELTSGTYGTYTGVIKDTTANSTNAVVNPTRAILPNVGITCSEFSILFDVASSTTSWGAVVKKVVVDFEPISLQN